MASSRSGRPISFTVGTSLIAPTRSGVVTNRARSVPAWICPITPERFWKNMSTCPPTSAAAAAPPPLYGTWVIASEAMPMPSSTITIAMCGSVPTPPVE